MTFPPSGKLFLPIACAAAFSITGALSLGENVASSAGELTSDPMKRLEWLKAHAPQPTPSPVRRASFRTSESRAVSLRAPVNPPAEE
jgi:hypothetical protein